MWCHQFLASRGLCSETIPVLRIHNSNTRKTNYHYRFYTWTSASLNWIHAAFYNNDVKVVPQNVADYLDPLALAVWIMDDGGKATHGGLQISTCAFTVNEVELLVSILKDKYGLKCSIQKPNTRPTIYIYKQSIPILQELVLPYMVKSMHYKLGL